MRQETPSTAALTERQAAAYLGYSHWYLRVRRRKGGGPPFIRVGRSVRYLPRDLDAWQSAHRVDGPTNAETTTA